MPKKNRSKTYLLLLLILSTSHLLNDLMQSLIPASYPLLKEKYALSFIQIGLISLTFQISGALLQPVVGLITDRKAAPYSPVIGMVFTFSGLISLAFAQNYQIILISVVLIGIGSSIFHPEATRMARYAAGNRQGFAQGVFQVGGQTGGALGPIFAAIILVPWGLSSLSIFATFALLAMILLVWIGSKQHEISIEFSKNQKDKKNKNELKILSPFTIFFSLSIMIFLVFTKNFYTESFRSFYTFYLIEHFGLSIQKNCNFLLR